MGPGPPGSPWICYWRRSVKMTLRYLTYYIRANSSWMAAYTVQGQYEYIISIPLYSSRTNVQVHMNIYSAFLYTVQGQMFAWVASACTPFWLYFKFLQFPYICFYILPNIYLKSPYCHLPYTCNYCNEFYTNSIGHKWILLFSTFPLKTITKLIWHPMHFIKDVPH